MGHKAQETAHQAQNRASEASRQASHTAQHYGDKAKVDDPWSPNACIEVFLDGILLDLDRRGLFRLDLIIMNEGVSRTIDKYISLRVVSSLSWFGFASHRF